jgi:hypothetical protein
MILAKTTTQVSGNNQNAPAISAPPVVQGTPVNAAETLNEIKMALGAVTVTSGDQSSPFEVAGETVAAVRASLTDAFSIHPQAKAYVDGQEVTETYLLQAGEQLEFLRQMGQKGSA